MNKLNLLLILFVSLFLSLVCLGSSADSDKYTGIVKYEGKTYFGGSKTEKPLGTISLGKLSFEANKS